MLGCSVSRVYAVALLLSFPPQAAICQSQARVPEDPFEQMVPALQIKDQTIVDGVAKLSEISDVAFSVEFPLEPSISSPAPPLRSFSSTFGSETLAKALDNLCELDRTFTWKRNGNTANIFPRSLENDSSYLMNRRIDRVTFKNTPDAQKAVFEAVAQLAGPKEQIAVLQSGLSIAFPHAWTASFKSVTVREVFDRIAQQLGPTYGWQFGGGADFRVVTFHQRLSVKPARASQR